MNAKIIKLFFLSDIVSSTFFGISAISYTSPNGALFFTLILPYLIISALRLLIYDIPILKLKETLNSDKKTISEAKKLLSSFKKYNFLLGVLIILCTLISVFLGMPLLLAVSFIIFIPVCQFILTSFFNEEEYLHNICTSLNLTKDSFPVQQANAVSTKNPDFQTNMENPTKLLFSFDGGVANRLEVYEDHCVLVAVKSTRALMTGNILNGNKEFYYSDLTSIQFKPATKMINGYIQFEYPGSHSGKGPDNFISENSFAFMLAKISNEEISKAVSFIKQKIRAAKVPQQQNIVMNPISEADEIEKFKNLLDKGVITQEEFEAKKKQIFGL